MSFSVFEGVMWADECHGVSYRDLILLSLYRGNMEANVSFEEEVGNYGQVYGRKIILLFEMSVTHDLAAFRGGVSSLCLLRLHPHTKKLAVVRWPVPFIVREK